MLQRLPIALSQVKVGNTPENLLKEIRQIIYFLYQEKEITKQVYNNINNIRHNTNMNTIFMNSEISKTSDPQFLQILTDKSYRYFEPYLIFDFEPYLM